MSALTAATEQLECLALYVQLPNSIDYTVPFRRCTLLEERTQHAAAMLVSTAQVRGPRRLGRACAAAAQRECADVGRAG